MEIMNYYKEIKTEIINNEITKKIKDYSKNKSDLTTYYNVGKLLSEAGKRYGEGIIKEYSKKLTKEFGKGYSTRTLKYMRKFYNFQKGSFSAICLLKDGGLTTFFGNYSLKGAEISIILLPESVNDKNYDTYFGWPEGKCTFKVEDLSYSSLRLEYGGTKSIFRKF